MKKKHTYRSINVQKVDAPRLLGVLPAPLVVVAIDVAKRKQFFSLFQHRFRRPIFCPPHDGHGCVCSTIAFINFVARPISFGQMHTLGIGS